MVWVVMRILFYLSRQHWGGIKFQLKRVETNSTLRGIHYHGIEMILVEAAAAGVVGVTGCQCEPFTTFVNPIKLLIFLLEKTCNKNNTFD